MSTKSIKNLSREKKDSSKKEVMLLKQENKELRRKISRLQKQLERGIAITGADFEDEYIEDKGMDIQPVGRIICPNCLDQGEIGSYQTMTGKMIYGCKKCKKWKHRET